MPLVKTSEIREMSPEERNDLLLEFEDELMHERGAAAMGGAPTNPGRIRALRTMIARILTVEKEEEEK
jgi:large subunit ribosomal protein L29